MVIFIGSRANYGRLKSVVKECPSAKIIAGCSALWENIKADEYISCLVSGDHTREMALTSGLLHIQITNVLDRLKPDLVLVHGDRYEVLNVAQVASYMNIPVAHTEGGELTGTIDDKVRYAISSLADYHFPVTTESASRLLFARNKNIHVVGSTAIDAVAELDLKREPKDYILVVFHPNTTEPESVQPLIDALKELNKPVKWVNPNVDAGSLHLLKEIYLAGFQVIKGLSPEEYYKLMNDCSILVGNTSSGIKEGSYLGVPYICIGQRQKDREHDSNTVFVENTKDNIITYVNKHIGKIVKKSLMFGDGTAGKKIAEVLK